MNANHKILEILIAEMGVEAILAICQERVKAKNTVVTPHRAPESQTEPKAPIKILGKKPVVVKKDESVAKNLSPQLSAAAASSPPSSFLCPPCGKGEDGDHRLCVLNAFDCDVAAWEKACGLRPAEAASQETPKPKGIVVIKKVTKKTEEKPLPEEQPMKADDQPKKADEPKKAGRPKKVVADVPRCDARIYGEQLEMEGTKAPNGKPLHCFRPAQCERKGGVTLAINENEEIRRLPEGEQPGEDEGKFHLCKVCVNRWEARSEHADNWHGFFDDDGAPETSHFLNGAWYNKKMTAAKAKSEEKADE
jgi:hypothetical protein